MKKARSKDTRFYGGRLNMPGYMMTKAGKREQIRRDNNRPAQRRRGKR